MFAHMRGRVLVFSLFFISCGSSNSRKDSAAPDLIQQSAFDAGSDTNSIGSDLVIDGGSCGPLQGSRGLSYDLDLSADAGSCDSRPTVPCGGTGEAGPPLDSQMMALLDGCGGLHNESKISVAFSQGCADHLYLGTFNDPSGLMACLAQALQASHFACAENIPCWGFGVSTLY